jgi:hypothetical protein
MHFEQLRVEKLEPYLAMYLKCALCGGAIKLSDSIDVMYHSAPGHHGTSDEWPPRDPDIQAFSLPDRSCSGSLRTCERRWWSQ